MEKRTSPILFVEVVPIFRVSHLLVFVLLCSSSLSDSSFLTKSFEKEKKRKSRYKKKKENEEEEEERL